MDVYVGNNDLKRLYGTGKVRAKTVVNGKMYFVTLNNVLYVPEIMYNLISLLR